MSDTAALLFHLREQLKTEITNFDESGDKIMAADIQSQLNALDQLERELAEANKELAQAKAEIQRLNDHIQASLL